jgi:predicted Zn-ribbon and HTH transcriptional regulator
MRTADCSNCGRSHAPADLNGNGNCPDCAQFARETNIFGGMR